MTLQTTCTAFAAALVFCAPPALADGHSTTAGFILEVPKNICAKTEKRLKRWSRNQTVYTAYVSTITSEQAAAQCFDIDGNSKLYAASHAKVKAAATIKALADCTVDNTKLTWCVVIGTLGNK